jgi:hypothetical protein
LRRSCAKPADPSYATGQLLLQKLNPYDALARFRLYGTDQDGVEWSLGWTVPHVDSSGEEWVFTGQTDSIATLDESSSVADAPSTELLFVVPPEHPLKSSEHAKGSQSSLGIRTYRPAPERMRCCCARDWQPL